MMTAFMTPVLTVHHVGQSGFKSTIFDSKLALSMRRHFCEFHTVPAVKFARILLLCNYLVPLRRASLVCTAYSLIVCALKVMLHIMHAEL